MAIIDNYLENINEGKTWDKVKKVWRDHKGKIYAGASLAIAAKAGYDYNKKLTKDKTSSNGDLNKGLARGQKRREEEKSRNKRYQQMLSMCPPGPDGQRRGKVVFGKFRCSS
jgi:hypothetical protein